MIVIALAVLLAGALFVGQLIGSTAAPVHAKAAEPPVEVAVVPPAAVVIDTIKIVGVQQGLPGDGGMYEFTGTLADPKATEGTVTLQGVLVSATDLRGTPLNITDLGGGQWTVSSKNGYWLSGEVHLVVRSEDGKYVGAPYAHAAETGKLTTRGYNGNSLIYAPGVYAPVDENGNLGEHGWVTITYDNDNTLAPSATFDLSNGTIMSGVDAYGFPVTIIDTTVESTTGLGLGTTVTLYVEGDDASKPFALPTH